MICELLNTRKLETDEEFDEFIKSQTTYENLINKISTKNIKEVISILKDGTNFENITAEVHIINILKIISSKFFGNDNKSKMFILEYLDTDLNISISNLKSMKVTSSEAEDLKQTLILFAKEIQAKIKFNYECNF